MHTLKHVHAYTYIYMLTYTDAHAQYPIHYPTHRPHLLSLPFFSPSPPPLPFIISLLFLHLLHSPLSLLPFHSAHSSPPLPSFPSCLVAGMQRPAEMYRSILGTCHIYYFTSLRISNFTLFLFCVFCLFMHYSY